MIAHDVEPRREGAWQRRVAAVALVVLLASTTAACGSRLSKRQLAAANGPLQVEGNGLTGAGGSSGVGGESGAAGGSGAADTGAAGGGAAGGATGGAAGAAGGGGSGGGSAGGGGSQSGGGGGGGAGCPAPCAPIVFGSLGTASGVLGAVTGPAVPALRAWTSYINDNGGLGGHKVQVIINDVAGDPVRAVSTVKQMVEQQHVAAMFNDFGFTEIDPVMKYLDSVNVPMIGTIGANAQADHAAMMFNPLVGADIGQSWAFLDSYRSYSNSGRLGTIYCREASVCASIVNGFKRFLPNDRGGVHQDLVYSVQASLVQPNFTAEVIGAQQAKVEVLLVLMDTASAARIAQAVQRQQGFHPILAATYNVNQDLILRYSELDGMVMNGRTPPWDSSAKLKFYRDAMQRYQPNGAMGDLGAGVFTVGKLLQKYAHLLPGKPGPADFLKLLYSIHGETLDGLLPGITFHPGDKSDVNECVVPERLQNGHFVAHDSAESFVCAPGWSPGR